MVATPRGVRTSGLFRSHLTTVRGPPTNTSSGCCAKSRRVVTITILGVEGEHTTRSDDHVVDVGIFGPDLHGVEHLACWTQPAEPATDDLLPLCPYPERPLVGVHVRDPREHGSERSRAPQLPGSSPHQLTRPVPRQVSPQHGCGAVQRRIRPTCRQIRAGKFSCRARLGRWIGGDRALRQHGDAHMRGPRPAVPIPQPPRCPGIGIPVGGTIPLPHAVEATRDPALSGRGPASSGHPRCRGRDPPPRLRLGPILVRSAPGATGSPRSNGDGRRRAAAGRCARCAVHGASTQMSGEVQRRDTVASRAVNGRSVPCPCGPVGGTDEDEPGSRKGERCFDASPAGLRR